MDLQELRRELEDEPRWSALLHRAEDLGIDDSLLAVSLL